MNKTTPRDEFADITAPCINIPLDFLPEIEDHNDPLHNVMQQEQDLIQSFGWNLNGGTVK